MNAIYARVSTEDQARTGYSLADQVRQCRQKLVSMGLTNIKEYIDDGYSGEFLDRPHLDRLRNDLRNKLITHIAVYDPDRLSRNLTNQLLIADEIEKANAQLMFVTGDYDASPEGRLFFSIRGAISAFEKAKIRERTMRGKRSKALSGKLVQNDELFGYDYDSENSMYMINPDEAEIVKLMFHLYTTRMYGISSLRAELKSIGVLNRKGNPFDSSTLHKMLCNETYAGTKWTFKTYDKTIGQKKRQKTARDQSEWIAVTVPAIIDQDTFNKAVECRRLNKVTAKRNTKTEYLLQNIIRCDACGYAMRGVRYPRKDKEYMYYVCTAYVNNIECNDSKSIPVKELDEAVWTEMQAATKKKQGLNIFRPKDLQPVPGKSKMESQLAKLKKRQAAILKWVADGTIEIDAAEKDLQGINKEMNAIQNALGKIAEPARAKEIDNDLFINAQTFEQKRYALLQSGIRVFARRENGTTSYAIRL